MVVESMQLMIRGEGVEYVHLQGETQSKLQWSDMKNASKKLQK
jgi:hypothetical protein